MITPLATPPRRNTGTAIQNSSMAPVTIMAVDRTAEAAIRRVGRSPPSRSIRPPPSPPQKKNPRRTKQPPNHPPPPAPPPPAPAPGGPPLPLPPPPPPHPQR